MHARPKSAGTAGIIAGVALAVVTVLFFTSGATPETFADPATGLSFASENASRFRTISVAAIITLIAAAIFLAGLAGVLHGRTPTRAAGVLYLGLLGIVGHSLGAFLWWASLPGVVALSARDQLAATHAFAAINQIASATDAFGNLFIGASVLAAGWAISATKVMSSTLGWFGLLTGVVLILAAAVPSVQLLYLGSFVLPVLWLVWAGTALRKAAA